MIIMISRLQNNVENIVNCIFRLVFLIAVIVSLQQEVGVAKFIFSTISQQLWAWKYLFCDCTVLLCQINWHKDLCSTSWPDLRSAFHPHETFDWSALSQRAGNRKEKTWRSLDRNWLLTVWEINKHIGGNVYIDTNWKQIFVCRQLLANGPAKYMMSRGGWGPSHIFPMTASCLHVAISIW